MIPFPTAYELITVSPLEHPLRTLLTGIPILYLAFHSLHFMRSINPGSTITFLPRDPLFTFRIWPGKINLTLSQKKTGLIKSYNGPAGTAFLGLLFFSAAQLLLVLVFKEVVYFFKF